MQTLKPWQPYYVELAVVPFLDADLKCYRVIGPGLDAGWVNATQQEAEMMRDFCNAAYAQGWTMREHGAI